MGSYKSSKEIINAAMQDYKYFSRTEKTVDIIAHEAGVSRMTVYRWIKQFIKKNERRNHEVDANNKEDIEDTETKVFRIFGW